MTSLTCLQHGWPYLAFTRIVGTNSDFHHTPFTAATKLFHVMKKADQYDRLLFSLIPILF